MSKVSELSARIRKAQETRDFQTVSELWPQLNIELQRMAKERNSKPIQKCKVDKKGVIEWPTKQTKAK